MVDLTNSIEKLPPAERLKRLRELEAEKRVSLEKELAARKKELAALEEKSKEELDEARELEEETLDEIEEQSQEQLEDRIKRFRDGNEFVAPPSGEAPGFGQAAGGDLYQSQAFQQAEQNIDYLLNATPASKSSRVDRERDLYQTVRDMAQHFSPDESYAFNKLQEQMQQIKEHSSDDFGYINRIENVLNGVLVGNYRQQEEAQKKRRPDNDYQSNQNSSF